jgi:hypothetical protein
MPAWLQQPPAWKREPVSVPAPIRTLPPPDVSVIDPRTMLDIDDLPRWLQNLSRSADSPVGGAVAASHEFTPPEEDGSAPRAEELADVAVNPDTPQEADQTPPLPDNVDINARTDMESAPATEAGSTSRNTEVLASSRPTPWWLSDRTLGLVLLGIVLAMIYVVLAVAGVI